MEEVGESRAGRRQGILLGSGSAPAQKEEGGEGESWKEAGGASQQQLLLGASSARSKCSKQAVSSAAARWVQPLRRREPLSSCSSPLSDIIRESVELKQHGSDHRCGSAFAAACWCAVLSSCLSASSLQTLRCSL